MVNFSDEHKAEGGNYFGQGVHKVQIASVRFDKTDDGKEFAEFEVTDESGEKEGSARVWFTTDASIKYAFSVIRGIFTHNAAEAKKDEVRKKVDAIKNTGELEKACQKLIGKEAFYTVYENPERTYQGKDGKMKNSYDKNIYGYEPKPREIQGEVKVEDVENPDTNLDEEPFAPGF